MYNKQNKDNNSNNILIANIEYYGMVRYGIFDIIE